MDVAVVGGCLLTGLRDVTNDLTALDATGHGRWVVVMPFDASPVCARFDTSVPAGPMPQRVTSPVDPASWRSSIDEEGCA